MPSRVAPPPLRPLRRARAAAVALALAGLAAPGAAGAGEPAGGEPCLEPLELTPRLVSAALDGADTAGRRAPGLARSGRRPAVVLGALPRPLEEASPRSRHPLADGEQWGAVVFLGAKDGRWSAFLPRRGESVVAAYASEDGRVFVVTMWTSEGPGPRWTVVRFDPDGRRACAALRFPEALNHPQWMNEYLEPLRLDVSAGGAGELLGYADDEDQGPSWYAYATDDGGDHWSTPRPRGRPARTDGGLAAFHARGAPKAVVAALERFARSSSAAPRAPARRPAAR